MKPGTEHYPRRPTLRGDRYPQPLELRRIQHIGISVRDLDRTLAFWEAFLGTPARWRRVLDAGYLGRVTGYAGVRIEAALIDLEDRLRDQASFEAGPRARIPSPSVPNG